MPTRSTSGFHRPGHRVEGGKKRGNGYTLDAAALCHLQLGSNNRRRATTGSVLGREDSQDTSTSKRSRVTRTKA